MNSNFRFEIHAQAAGDGWDVTLRCSALGDGWEPIPRRMELQEAHGQRFPALREEDLPADDARDLCSGADPERVSAIFRRLGNRGPRDGELQLFGRYLFCCLIGDANWERIQNAVPDAGLIELALSWPADETDLGRLNWELMHGPEPPPDGFLASGSPCPVAVTRRVSSIDLTPEPVEAPPRVLFVIGAPLTDPHLRPGAEILGLLREFEDEERSLHSRVLQSASPERLRQAIRDFTPHVVHFICHGLVDKGKSYLILQLDEDAQPDEPSDGRRDSVALAQDLRAAGDPPLIVVMSACYSATPPKGKVAGDSMPPQDTAPLAAQLVQSGVPIVIGMAGRISDLACRLFTRRFGQALVGGKPLVTAMEEGRRGAFAEGTPYEQVDWAFPAMYLAKGVTSGFAPVRVSQDDRAVRIRNILKGYPFRPKPAFCDRQEFFDAYYELLRNNDRPVLAAYTDQTTKGFGRSRLLHTLAVQALRDGHIPLPVIQPEPAPTSAKDLAKKLLEALTSTRDAFSLGPDFESQLYLLSQEDVSDQLAQLEERIRWEIQLHKKITLKAIQKALLSDLGRLRAAVLAKHPTLFSAKARTLLFLDDVDLYGDLVHALFDEFLGDDGLGPLEGNGDGGQAVPVVLTFSLNGVSHSHLRPLVEEKRPAWMRSVLLQPFRQNGEDLLAFERVWMHPFREDSDFQGIADVPWVINHRAEDNVRDEWHALLRKRLSRMPIDFEGDIFFILSELAARDRFLIRADDEALLAKKQGGE